MQIASSKIVLATVGLLLLSAPASASIEWSGFANIGGGTTLGSNQRLFGYEDNLDFSQDSLFALQGRAEINERVSVTTQLMSRGSKDFDLDVEWAYIQYQLSDSASINAGKLRLPLYMYSDSVDVGYTYHWLRTPQSVYRVPFNNYTGVSLQHNAFVGNWVLSNQLIGGNLNEDIEAAGTLNPAQINNIVGFNSSANYDNWTFRVGLYTSDDVTIDIQSPEALSVITTLTEANQWAAIRALDVYQERGNFAGAGIMYDNFTWFFGAEYTQLEVKDSYIPKQQSAYATAGRRFGQTTLHATFAVTDDRAQRPQDLIVNNNTLAQFVAEAANIQVSRVNYSSLGVRHDLSHGVALKLDFTHADDKRSSSSAQLLSFAVHVVF